MFVVYSPVHQPTRNPVHRTRWTGNLRLLYDVIIDHLIKKYMIISANDCIYIYIDSMYYEDRGRIEKDINKILKQGGYSRTRKITEIVREIMKRIKAETMKFKEFPFNKKAHIWCRCEMVLSFGNNWTCWCRNPRYGGSPTRSRSIITLTHRPNPLTSSCMISYPKKTPGFVQAVAQALLQNENYQLSYLLTGQGANGKSTYQSGYHPSRDGKYHGNQYPGSHRG